MRWGYRLDAHWFACKGATQFLEKADLAYSVFSLLAFFAGREPADPYLLKWPAIRTDRRQLVAECRARLGEGLAADD